MELHKNTKVLLVKTSKEWEDWLKKNHEKVPAVWLKFAKKNSQAVSITYDDALLVALCFGWIDGLLNKLDETYYLIRFTPRKTKSVWSKRNVQLVSQLVREGKMQQSGYAVIEAAKANGSWQKAYESAQSMKMPKDFLTELEKEKKAYEFFKSLSRANAYAIYWRLQTAKREETRRKRMETILAMLKKGETFY